MSDCRDEILARYLDALQAMAPPVERGSMSERALAAILRARVPATRFEPPRDVLIEDHVVPVAAGAIAVRRYQPVSGGGRGAVLNMHGGGWVLGDIASDESRCRTLAATSGCQLFSVEYRRAPEHPFPVPLEDCYAALEWLARAAARFGIDPRRIAVSGSSAGGNLAAAVAIAARDRQGPPIAFQLLVYPVCDHGVDRASWRDHADVFPLTADEMRWFWNQYAPREKADDPLASVLRCSDLARLPPAHVAVAECDILRDEGLEYADRLAACGVAVTRTVYPGMVHGFLAVAPDHPVSREALAAFAQILSRAIG